ncbi:YveK family protein [Microaceticoccus formicicus]|uniref:YveK family protein n=1 Tax=Microaceticoccus formicicus TaxID=3118105 RepID=UPI003CCFFBDF|nr:Wzz/FepE/Etk N-terminal domain-containing protein [Peptoniphilaceae bacterium AMB_02]
MEEISLLELWYGIRKRILFIIFLTLLFGAAAFGVSKFLITPQYEASTTMVIGKPKDYGQENSDMIKYSDIQLNQKLVTTYSEIIKSRGIAKQVIDNLDLNVEVKELAKAVSVQTVKDTEVITVKVIDTIPRRAVDIANETSEIFRDSIKVIMNIDNVQILDAAELPEKPIKPSVLRNTAIGLILGLFISVGIAIVKETLDTTIKSPEEITSEFNLTVLGVIPNVKSGGLNE